MLPSSRWALSFGSSIVLGLSSQGYAAPAAPPAASASTPAASAPTSPPVGSTAASPALRCEATNALSAIACELSLGLPAELGRVAVATAPIEASQGARWEELGARLVHVVAGRFAGASELGTLPLAVARGRASDANQLLYLRPRLNEGHFEVSADLYTVVRGFWDRVREAPGPLAHVFATRRLDAEIGSFLPVPKLLGKVEAKVPLPTEATALSCEDVDGDRALELVVAGRRELVVGRPLAGKFTSVGHVSWQELSPVAPAPLRQPLAAVFVETGRLIRWGSSDRRDMVELGPDLALRSRVPGKQPWGSLGCAERRGQGLSNQVSECSGTRRFEQIGIRDDLDVVAGTVLVTATGSVRVLAARGVGQSSLEIQDGDGRLARLDDVGAQVALGDLDHDGTLEVLTSKDTLNRQEDVLSVHSWRPQGVSLSYRLPVPTGIDAVAVCPAEDSGASLVVVAAARELWFVR